MGLRFKGSESWGLETPRRWRCKHADKLPWQLRYGWKPHALATLVHARPQPPSLPGLAPPLPPAPCLHLQGPGFEASALAAYAEAAAAAAATAAAPDVPLPPSIALMEDVPATALGFPGAQYR